MSGQTKVPRGPLSTHRIAAARGVALVSVLLIVAIVTALAFEIANRHAFSVAASRQTLDGSQARQYALGGEQFARQLLHDDWEDETTRAKDTLLEPWAVPEEAFEIENGSIEIRIEDLSSRFNMNSVVGRRAADNLARLKRLLTHLGLDPDTADAWRDWIDADEEASTAGAEDADYLLREPPHLAANQPAAHVTEFLLAVPLELDQYALLRPHVAVVPSAVLNINVNTATDVVLGSVSPNFPPADAQRLTSEPREFDKVENVIASHAPLGEGAGVLTVVGTFFRVQVRVLFAGSRAELTSVLHRDRESGKLDLVSRSFGERFEAAPQKEEQEEA